MRSVQWKVTLCWLLPVFHLALANSMGLRSHIHSGRWGTVWPKEANMESACWVFVSTCLWLWEKIVLVYAYSCHKKFPSYAVMLKFLCLQNIFKESYRSACYGKVRCPWRQPDLLVDIGQIYPVFTSQSSHDWSDCDSHLWISCFVNQLSIFKKAVDPAYMQNN